MALSEDFINHVDNAEHSGISAGGEQMALDNIKNDIMQMSTADRVAAFQYMIKQNQDHVGLPQLSIEGDVRTSNFKVQALTNNNKIESQ